jgi:hypothetical protein
MSVWKSSLWFLLVLPALSQVNGPKSPPSAATPPKASSKTTTAKSAAVGPPLVTEINQLVLAEDAKGTGVVTITGQSDDCSEQKFAGKMDVGPGYEQASGGAAFISLMFLPGVRHSYSGKACLPAADMNFKIVDGNIHADTESNGRTEIGRMTVSGPAEITCTIGLDPANQAKAFQIRSTGAKPLVLEVTKRGYRYVSGSGTVQTPSGKRFNFPN